MPERSARKVNDPLVMILATALREIADRDDRMVRWSIESGRPLITTCRCADDVGELRCVCSVEVDVDPSWLLEAQARVAEGRHPGIVPSGRCPLCRDGDHVLVDPSEVHVEIVGAGRATYRLADPSMVSMHQRRLRAERAGGHLPGDISAQLLEIFPPRS